MITKKIFACLLVSVISVTLFGCEKAGKTVSEETTIPETTAVTLSEEELDKMAENMPEIVFIMSHHYDDTNILGCYITNTGEMKMYDFRNIAPDEIYEVPDIYDRLEEAVCSEIDFSLYRTQGHLFTEKDLAAVPENKLVEYYKSLLQINGTAIERRNGISLDDPQYGHYRCYGIKYDSHGNQQFILLQGMGEDYSYDYNDSSIDDLVNELFNKMYSEIFIAFYDSLRGVWHEY